MDAFGTEDRWWTAPMRTAYRNALGNRNVVGIFAGHSHGAFQYDWEGLHVMQVNNAKAEISTGNKDGNGSFAIARVTDGQFSMMTCRWLNDQGSYELIGPHYNVTW
jgi:cytolysin (calcineurin-like family phosphatase)